MGRARPYSSPERVRRGGRDKRRRTLLVLVGLAGVLVLVLALASPFRAQSGSTAGPPQTGHVTTRLMIPLSGETEAGGNWNDQVFSFSGSVEVLAQVTMNPAHSHISLIFDPRQLMGMLGGTEYHAAGAQPFHFDFSGMPPSMIQLVNYFRFVGTGPRANPRSEVMSVPTLVMIGENGMVRVELNPQPLPPG